jgi:diguanylate cyclase (GGDEF)-like protein
VVVESVRRTFNVTWGVVLPLIGLVALGVLGLTVGPAAVYIAMMAAVPMMSAGFARMPITAVVAALTVVAGFVVAFVATDGLEASKWSLVGVVVLSAVAVVASLVRGGHAAAAEPSERRKGVQFQLQTQAETDAMTGLLNRRGAIRALGAKNGDTERVVAFVDCDLFKGINDQFGNEVGDEYLQAVAGRLRHNLPPLDTVARWDGDEFLVVIAADAATAGPPLARIAATINSHPIRTTAGPIPGSVSIGAAVWGVGQELEDVIARSGGALYQAKAAGRSQVVVDDGSVARRATADSGLVVPEAGA